MSYDGEATAYLVECPVWRGLHRQATCERPSARRVEWAARQLGHVPNRAACSLVTGRSDFLAVVIPEPTTRIFGEPFFPRVIRGISEVLFAHDLQLVLLTPQSETDEARVGRHLAAGYVDGVLLVSLHGDDPFWPSWSSANRRSWVPVRQARWRRSASLASQAGADPSRPGGDLK